MQRLVSATATIMTPGQRRRYLDYVQAAISTLRNPLQIDSPVQSLPVPADLATDRADLDALRRGDEVALNRLIARWERPLIGFAFRYLGNSADARDLVAETFVRLYRNRERA